MVKKLQKILKWFTLVELIIVIWIVATLSAAAFLILTHRMSKSRDARKIADINSLSKGVLIYELENFGYPSPSNSISLTDQYWNEIWKQWLFDKAVVDQLSSIHKTVKDPFTNEYYSYTTYDKYRWFEIWTFMEALWKVTYNIHNKAFAESTEEINPYVFVYWKVKVCEDNWEIKYPNPISVYDNNNFKYANTKTMWRWWKIMFNMKYLNWSKKVLEWTWSLCDSEVQAPIVWYVSYNTWMNLKQTHKEKIIDTNDWILEIIQEECTHNSLCNSPDIYRVKYNLYIIVYYNPSTWEITLIEAEYNPTTNKFEKKTKEKIYNGGWTSSESWKIYWIANSPNWKYQIYYGGWNGWVQVYTQWLGGWTNTWNTWTIWWGWTEFENMTLDKWVSVAQGEKQTVLAFSKSWTNESYISTITENNWIISQQTIKLPFECKMPKIIYVDENEYLIVYIDENWNSWVSRVKYDNSSLQPVFLDSWFEWSLENINDVKIALVWSNIVASVNSNDNWQIVVKTKEYENGILIDRQSLLLDDWTISNIQVKSWWKWDLNVTYTKWTTNIAKYYQISNVWDIVLKNTSTVNCENPTLSQLSSSEYVNICWWSSIQISKLENDKVNIIENEWELENDNYRNVNIAIDESWIANSQWWVYSNWSLQLWKTKTLTPISKFSSDFGGNNWSMIEFKIGVDQFLWILDIYTSEFKIYKYNWTQFGYIQSITWHSASWFSSKFDYFNMEWNGFITVSNNFYNKYWTASNKSAIYKRNWSKFELVQVLPSWAYMKYFQIGSEKYLIQNIWYYASCSASTVWSAAAGSMVCNYTYQKASILYKRNWTQFVSHQQFPLKYRTNYAHLSDIIEINGDYYLNISAWAKQIKYKCWTSTCYDNRWSVSYIYKWNWTSFVEFKNFGTPVNYLLILDFISVDGNYYLSKKLGQITERYKWDWNDFSLTESIWISSLASNYNYIEYTEWSDYFQLYWTNALPTIIVNWKSVIDTSYKYLYLYKWDWNKYNLYLNTIDIPIHNALKITIWWVDYILALDKDNNVKSYEFGEQSMISNYALFNNTITNSIYLYNGKSITNVIIDETKPSWTDIKYLISFDRQNTFRTKVWDEWLIVDDSEIWTKGMSSDELKQALIGFEITENTYLDFKIWLISNDPNKTSSIQWIRITYEKE